MRAFHLAAALSLLAAPALAQTTLRIGIGADPNGLDPAQSGSFVERLVFSAPGDKPGAGGPEVGEEPTPAEGAGGPARTAATMTKVRPGGAAAVDSGSWRREK